MNEEFERNTILRLLPHSEVQRLAPHLQKVTLNFKEELYDEGDVIRQVYFPTRGVVSLIVPLQNEQPVEAGTIGSEGMVGLPAFLGNSRSPWRALCQIGGVGLRMPAERLLEIVRHDGALAPLLLRYTNAVLTMTSRTAACNRAHSLEERMARWLLMTHDRMGADDEIPLTQEFMGQMLGVRRPSVSLAGAALQKAGVIRYKRGRISVLDRAGLEEVSCECYGIVRRQFDEALNGVDIRERA